MKKSLISLILFVTFLNLTTVFSAEIPAIPVETEDEIISKMVLPVDDLLKGDTVYVDIKLDCKKSIYAFELNLEFDSSILEYKTVDVPASIDSDIIIEELKENGLLFVFSKKSENFADASEKICTIEFSSLKKGSGNITLASVKAVFDDMTYFVDSNKDQTIDVTVKTKKTSTASRPSGSSGGGGGGGKVSVSGGKVTSSGADKPEEPKLEIAESEIKPQTESEAEPEKITDSLSYVDLDTDFWAYTSIIRLSEEGIINGFEDGSFKPEQSISRSEFAKILTENESVKIINVTEYSDVLPDDWFYNCVMKASEMGIVNGFGNGLFSPHDSITREQAAVMLHRLAEFKEISLLPNRGMVKFTDTDDVSDYAEKSIELLYTCGIINGFDNGKFYPQANLTRAEAASMLDKFYTFTEEVSK